MPLIELKNITKRYSNGDIFVEALKDVSLDVHKGDFLCVAGPSGSGKSTLLHIAGILDTPSEGSVAINGKQANHFSRTSAALFRRKNIGFVFQRFNLIPVLTALENVAYVLAIKGMSPKKRNKEAEKVLETVGLAKFLNHKAASLSGGQQQRVAVARAIVAGPQIILADEPTGNLDSANGLALIALLADINQNQSTTFIFSSHDPRIIARANRVVTLEDGKIVS